MAVLAVIVALGAITNSERTMRSPATLCPIWTWTEGPFPGRDAKSQ
jgi:hypothetical protein